MTETNAAAKRPARPAALGLDPAGVPEGLRALPCWVVWRYEWESAKDGRGRWAKPPINPKNGHKASVTHPRSWVRYDAALQALATGKYDGVGVVLHSAQRHEDETSLFCLDIDDCRDAATGRIDDDAQVILTRLTTFSEVSPSGTGLHVWFLARLKTRGNRVGRHELYCGARYMTVTGQRVESTPPQIQTREQEAAAVAFDLRLIPLKWVAQDEMVYLNTLRDEEVIRRCWEGPGGARFASLFQGNSDGYTSESEADLGFCARIAFYSQDPSQIETIWRGSGRWREKCEAHPTYVTNTIRLAIESCANYYDPQFRSKRPPAAPPPAEPPPPPTRPSSSAPERTPAPANPPPRVSPEARAPEPKAPPRKAVRASDLRMRQTSWLVDRWIPRGEVSLVVGPANVGKSTFATWLLTQAKSAVVLPGFEESLEGQFLSRLLAVHPSPDKVWILPGMDWSLPGNARPLEEQVSKAGAELLLIDPIDSYLDADLSENDQRAVRAALESLVRVAHATDCAVVCIRHPGKAAGNVCPGSRAWRAVPRCIVEFVVGLDQPPTRFLHIDKEVIGSQAPDTYYHLVPVGPAQPPRFVLGTAVDSANAEVARLVTDRLERRKLDVACDLLKQLLMEGEQEAGWLLASANKLGLSPGTLYLAADRIGVTKRAVGGGKNAKHFWCPNPLWKQGDSETDTGGGGVSGLEGDFAGDPEPPEMP